MNYDIAHIEFIKLHLLFQNFMCKNSLEEIDITSSF